MARFMLSHRHKPEEYRAAYAARRGIDSPLRGHPTLEKCKRRGRMVAAVSTAALGLLLVAPAASQAANFYVNDDSTAEVTPCTDPDPSKACNSIQEAIVQARDAGMFAGPDAINVFAGTYNEDVSMTQDADTGNTIDGSGADTVINPIGIGLPRIQLGDATGAEANFVVRDLKAVTPEGVVGTAAPGILIQAPGSTLDNVDVEMLEDNNSQSPVRINPLGSGATLNRVRVPTPAANVPGVAVQNANATVRDSQVAGGTGINNSPALEVFGVTATKKTVLVQRSQLSRHDANGEVVEYTDTDLTIESSLITGGATSVQGFTGSFSPITTLRNVTMDAMTPGVSDPTGRGLRATSCCGLVHLATIDSSISLEPQQAFKGASGNSNVNCTSSDVPQQDEPGDATNGLIACGAAQGNTSSSPAALFAGGMPFDYHLKFGSPAIDTGTDTPAGTGGESTTDIDGQSRVLDGDNNGNARRDKGADEHVFVAPPPGGGGGTPTPTPLTPITAAPDNSAECAALRAKLKKAKSKRKKRKIRAQLRKLGC